MKPLNCLTTPVGARQKDCIAVITMSQWQFRTDPLKNTPGRIRDDRQLANCVKRNLDKNDVAGSNEGDRNAVSDTLFRIHICLPPVFHEFAGKQADIADKGEVKPL